MRSVLVLAIALVVAAGALPASAQKAMDALVEQASRYVLDYEGSFWLLAMDEEQVQWIERPTNPGSNLSRNNPGGGMVAGGAQARRIIKSDYLLVQGGEGRGWTPFRDVLSVNGSELRHQDDRLVRMFRSGNVDSYDLAQNLQDESKKHDLGNVARTINIPMLGMMLLHPDVRERFSVKHDGSESLAGRLVERFAYRETARPTLIKTVRGRDLALTGRLWIEPATGVVVKTEMVAADPVVRAMITVTFRRDTELGFWVPEPDGGVLQGEPGARRHLHDVHVQHPSRLPGLGQELTAADARPRTAGQRRVVVRRGYHDRRA